MLVICLEYSLTPVTNGQGSWGLGVLICPPLFDCGRIMSFQAVPTHGATGACMISSSGLSPLRDLCFCTINPLFVQAKILRESLKLGIRERSGHMARYI